MSIAIILIYTEGFNLKSPWATSKYINYELWRKNSILESCGLKVLAKQRGGSPVGTSRDVETYLINNSSLTRIKQPPPSPANLERNGLELEKGGNNASWRIQDGMLLHYILELLSPKTKKSGEHAQVGRPRAPRRGSRAARG